MESTLDQTEVAKNNNILNLAKADTLWIIDCGRIPPIDSTLTFEKISVNGLHDEKDVFFYPVDSTDLISNGHLHFKRRRTQTVSFSQVIR